MGFCTGQELPDNGSGLQRLDRELYLELVLSELFGTLNDIVGNVEAQGYFAVVGNKVGRRLNNIILQNYGTDRLDRNQLVKVFEFLCHSTSSDFSTHGSGNEVMEFRKVYPPSDIKIERSYVHSVASSIVGYIAAHSAGHVRVRLTQETDREDGVYGMTLYLNQQEGEGSVYYKEEMMD